MMKRWFGTVVVNPGFLWLVDVTLSVMSGFCVAYVYNRFGFVMSLWWLAGIPASALCAFFAMRALIVLVRGILHFLGDAFFG